MKNTVYDQEKDWKSQNEIVYPAPKANANILQTDLQKGTESEKQIRTSAQHIYSIQIEEMKL